MPTKAIEILHEHFGENLIIVGDKKTPQDWNYKNATYILFEANKYHTNYTPENHYARKNIGYLAAIKNKATVIYDSDDDTIPNENWKVRMVECFSKGIYCNGWYNVYNNFYNGRIIWPRGFSLTELSKISQPPDVADKSRASPIQQGLVNGEPDVDAIWRLTARQWLPELIKRNSIYLEKNTWCPFNSQSTWFFPEAYPLLYLPCYASFRMTDIWRSFVAQKCLWAMGYGVTFHSPAEVYQQRNPHDLLKDFEDEVPGYLHNDRIVEILTSLKLDGDIFENVATCYQAIVDEGILPEMEMRSLNAWIKDIKEYI